MNSLTTFLAAALVLFAFGQAIAAKGAELPYSRSEASARAPVVGQAHHGGSGWVIRP